jgi:hypothetical protein
MRINTPRPELELEDNVDPDYAMVRVITAQGPVDVYADGAILVCPSLNSDEQMSYLRSEAH